MQDIIQTFGTAGKHPVLIVSSLRNEAPYLLEWIAHYIQAGASHFLLFSNDCDDGTDAMLDALANAGVVTHVPHTPQEGHSIQWQALRAAWKHDLRKQGGWALVCDVDEFIHIRTAEQSFDSLIDALPPQTDAITLAWRNFGAVGAQRDLEHPVVQSATQAMSPDLGYPIAATLFKTLFRLDGPFNQFGVHRPAQKRIEKARAPVWVDGSGAVLPEWFATRPSTLSLRNTGAGRGLADMHHYSLRSNQEFIVKRHRGLPNKTTKELGLRYWIERNFLTTSEPGLLPVSKSAENLRQTLRALPNVEAQYQRGLTWHREAFENLITDEANYQLYSDTQLAGASSEVPLSQQADLYRRYQSLRHAAPPPQPGPQKPNPS